MMETSHERRWHENYGLLRSYIAEHGHLPDKKKVEGRGLLNWWKYNKRLIKQGRQLPSRIALMEELSRMRQGRVTPLL